MNNAWTGRRMGAAQRLSKPVITATWLKEPLLGFAGDSCHVDVKTGIAVFGPASLGTSRHPAQIRLGYVGSPTSIQAAQRWFQRASEGVLGSPGRMLPDFPGFSSDRGFFSDLISPDHLIQTLTINELEELKRVRSSQARFEAAVALVDDRVRLLATQDDPPNLIVLALPDSLVGLASRAQYSDPERGRVFRDFRRALKATLMRHKIPTQILLQRVTEAPPDSPSVDHVSRVAWNLLTSLFYKAGGVPWRPIGLEAKTCYLGISFHRPLGNTDSTLRTSVAQAFDEYGTGLVLRGPEIHWDVRKGGQSPHLDSQQAKDLIDLALTRYKAETKRFPTRVVIHKTSRFWEAEKEGFHEALRSFDRFDLVALSATSEVRLVRVGNYPPLRGTYFTVGQLAYLYTTGYISALNAYPHGHVPSPLEIADHFGDSPGENVAEELLVLTKMNWNTAGFAGALPVTIRFSRQVGDIMREIPPDQEPLPQYKFYS